MTNGAVGAVAASRCQAAAHPPADPPRHSQAARPTRATGLFEVVCKIGFVLYVKKVKVLSKKLAATARLPLG